MALAYETGLITPGEPDRDGRSLGAVEAPEVGDDLWAVLVELFFGVDLPPGDALVELHYRDAARVSAARDLVRAACVIADEPPATGPLVLEVIEGQPPARG